MNTNIAALAAQRHLAQHSRNLAARFETASRSLDGTGRDIARLSTALAKDKLLVTAATLVLRKANELQAHSIDLLV